MQVQERRQHDTGDVSGALAPELHLRAVDLERIAADLVAYHARFAPLFARQEQRAWAEVYLRGLLVADVPRKNVEALAVRLLGAVDGADRRVRALQHFVGEGAWDDDAILAEHQRFVDETLGEADGVLIIDGSDVPKQGTHSAGVARQWCGATGKKDHCQAGVFLGYASRKGATLLDRRLYLPAAWFTEALAGVPHPGGHAVPDQTHDRGGSGGTSGAAWDAARPLGDLRRGLRRRPGVLSAPGRARPLLSGRGPLCHAGLAANRSGDGSGAGASAGVGAAPDRLPQRAGAAARTGASRQSAQAARRRHRRRAPGRSVAALPHPGGEQGAAGGRLCRRAGDRGARRPTGAGGLGGAAPESGGAGRGAGTQILPEQRPGGHAAGHPRVVERDAVADRVLFRRV